MLNKTVVVPGAFLLLSAALLTGCPQPVATCSPSTCAGCCTINDECVLATSAVSCGGSGSLCVECVPGQQCLFGLCSSGGATGGGGGSVTGGGGGSMTGGGGGSVTGGGGGSVTGGGGGSVTGGGGGSVTGGGGGSVTGGGGGSVTGGGGGGSTTLPMRLFVTSVTTSGGFGGLAQADALCNTAAQAANKGGTWKAWLSDSTTAAPSRFADVGPWAQQQPDGGLIITFNNKANLSTTPLAGISLDEQGRSLSTGAYWTGTNGGGTIGSTCTSWTNTNGYIGTYGTVGTTTTAWTSGTSSTNCNGTLSLLCFEQSHLPAPSSVPSTRKRLFVTSVTTHGGFGGLAQADALCNTSAQAANKGGTWKAWLSDSTTAAPSRFADVGPWAQQQPDGGLIVTFNNKANLNTTPLAGISRDEQGRSLSTGAYWTGTNGGGTIGSTCTSWTNTNGYIGTYGTVGTTTTAWTSGPSATTCNGPLSLLCFEQ